MTDADALAVAFIAFGLWVALFAAVNRRSPDPDLASPDGWDPEKAAAWDSLWDAGHDR